MLNFRYAKILTITLLLISVQACEKNNCLSSGGSIVQEQRKLDAFQFINTYNNFEIYLINDSSHKVEIQAGEKLIPYIETSVENGILTIKDLNKCDFLKGYERKKIFISVDTLKEININNASDLFTVDTFRVEELKVKFLSQLGYCDLQVDAYIFQLQVWYASGNFKVGGRAYTAYLDAESTSFIYADSLETQGLRVNSNSMGDCYVKAGKWMYYDIWDSGNIYYQGTPDTIIVENHTGTGKLIKRD